MRNQKHVTESEMCSRHHQRTDLRQRARTLAEVAKLRAYMRRELKASEDWYGKVY